MLKNIFSKSILEHLTNILTNSKLTRDMLKDNGSDKYSQTKISAMLIVIMVLVMDIVALRIMYMEHEIDHIIILENIGFAATLLGFKNYRKQVNIEDIKTNKSTKENKEDGLLHD